MANTGELYYCRIESVVLKTCMKADLQGTAIVVCDKQILQT